MTNPSGPLRRIPASRAPAGVNQFIRNTTSHRKVLVKTGLGVLTFALGLHGFIEVYKPATIEVLVECVFRTVQLLFAQFPPAVAATDGRVGIPLSLNIARFAMPALFLWLAASALVTRIRQPLRAAAVGLLRDHVIISGEGELAAPLLRGAKAAKRKAVVIAATVATPTAVLAEASGAAVVLGDPSDPACWRRAGLGKAHSAVILGPGDAPAVAAALAVAEAARTERVEAGDPVNVVCSIDDPDLRSLVESAYRGRDPLAGVALQTSSPAEARARAVIQRHPLHRSVDVEAGEPVRALVIGFGATGEQVALQVLRSGVVAEDAMPSVVVVDRRAGHLGRAFRRRHDHAPPLQAIHFIETDTDVTDEESLSGLLRSAPAAEANVIYVCLEEDTRGLLTAVAIRRALAGTGRLAPPIYCRHRGATDLSAQLASAEVKGLDLTRIHGFGRIDEGNLEAFTGEALDRRARAVHEYYLANFLPAPGSSQADSQRPWPLLGEVFRQSSRDQADYLPLRLASLALRETPGTGPLLHLPPESVERAARAEHARWAVSAQLIGWRHGPTRDNDRMLHPNLVAYDGLSERDKDKDLAVMADMAGLLAREGRTVRPLVKLAFELEAGETSQATAERMQVELQRLAPDAVPVIISRLESAGACEALHTLARARSGLLWRLELSGEVTEVLGAIVDPRTRQKARWLINHAEQVLPARR